jgi:hypothetical protein
MTAPTTTPAAEQYLADVERELADLPADERAELLEDLALHLVALEEDNDGRALDARLGSPTDYAVELRTAAGLPPRTTDPEARRGWGARARWLKQRAEAGGKSRAVRELREFVPQLRPAWWVLRGYLLVAVPCLWHRNRARDFPVPAPQGSHALGAALVVAAVLLSITVGRRRLPKPALVAVLLVDLVLLFASLQVIRDVQTRITSPSAVRTAFEPDPFRDSALITRHGPVTNILPFSADGTPLTGVLLYDQDGRGLISGQQRWFPDHCRRLLAPPRAADGTPVPFSYPMQYVLDPEGKTIYGGPVTTPCAASLPKPAVVLPVFPKPTPQPVARPVVKK